VRGYTLENRRSVERAACGQQRHGEGLRRH
jgi:hypothetical protein